MNRKLLSIVLAALMILTVFAGCGKTAAPAAEAPAATEAPAADAPAVTEAPAAPAETYYLTCAATPTTAARFNFFVAVCKGIMEEYPELNITVSETQGTTDATQKINQGSADFGNGMCCSDM